MAIISIKKSVAVVICCVMSCYMLFVGAGSTEAGILDSAEALAMGTSDLANSASVLAIGTNGSAMNTNDTGMDTSSVAVSTSVSANSANDPANNASDSANSASAPANVESGVPTPTSYRIDDGLGFNSMIGETLYIGTYNHVSSVTFQRPRPTSSSWTQPPMAYESVAEAVLWRVMGEEEGDGALTLLSEYVIDSRRFHENENWLDYNYVKSEIRAWLNGPFLMEAFSPAENSSLAKTTVIQKIWDPENNEWADGAFTAIWGRSDPAAHTTDFPKISYGDKVYLPWREYRSNLFHWDAGNKTVQEYAISGETAEVRLRNQRKETDTGNDIRVLSRSPMPESSNHILPASDSVYSDGNYTTSCYGIRPIVKLIPTRVLYAEKLDEGAYRLTLVNEEIVLSSVTIGGKPLSNGIEIAMPDQGALPVEAVALGHEGLAYKAVRERDGIREIATYGFADRDKLMIASLAKGQYTVYVWAQSSAAAGAEGSEPMYFTLNVNADPPIQDIENEQNGQASLSGQDGQSGQGSLSGQNRQENQASLSGQDSQANLSEQNGQGNLDGAVMVGASAPDWLNGKSISIFIIALGIVTAILLKR